MSQYEGPDPHDIVPADFPYPSVEAAREDSTGDLLARERCPECGSPDIHPRSSKACSRSEHAYTCRGCGAGFDDPLDPAAELPACEDCGRRLYVTRLRASVYRCLNCETTWWTLDGFGGASGERDAA